MTGFLTAWIESNSNLDSHIRCHMPGR